MAKRNEDEVIEIKQITTAKIKFLLLGTTALLMHRYPMKAWHELLLPKGRKNAAERAETLKHDPLMEFRESVYRNRDSHEPAMFHLPTGCFTKGMANAALDIPGATKAAITRLVWITSMQINLFGVPQMHMAMVRQSDMRHTPDVRTRAMFPEWACEIEVSYVSTILKQHQIANLLSAAGQIIGVCEWRQEKGGPYGKFTIVDENNEDYKRIVKQQGREPQHAALMKPSAVDPETEELYAWFVEEAARREKVVPSGMPPPTTPKSKRNGGKEKRN